MLPLLPELLLLELDELLLPELDELDELPDPLLFLELEDPDELLEDEDRLLLLVLELLREGDRVYPERLDFADRFLTLDPPEDLFFEAAPLDLDVLLRMDDVLPEDLDRVLLLPVYDASDALPDRDRVAEREIPLAVDALPADERPPREVPRTVLPERPSVPAIDSGV